MHIYDEEIARHYAAFRPPLHQVIMGEVFPGQEFETGLDIGCGTGCSTIVLADYCGKVIGIDHSHNMLDMATRNPKVTYLFGSANDLPIEDASVDLVSFAGVLPYLNMDAVMRELKRVCRGNAFLCPYDFDVILGELMRQFSLPETPDSDPYDHTRNLSDQAGISTLKQVSDVVVVSVTEQQAAHILLSEKSRHDQLCLLFDMSDPFDPIVDKLKQDQWTGTLEAKIHYALHQLEC